MAEGNGNQDWRERMDRIEATVERNWADHERMDRNISNLHASLSSFKDNTDKVVTAIRELIGRIAPETLKA